MQYKGILLILVIPLLISVSCSSRISETENLPLTKSPVEYIFQVAETEQFKITPTFTPTIIDEVERKPVLSTTTPSAKPVDTGVCCSTINFQPWELITSIEWSQDGRYLIISAGTVIYIYDVESQQFIGSYKVKALTHTLDISQNGEWLVSGSRDGVIRVWQFDQMIDNLAAGKDMPPVYQIDAHKRGINSVSFVNPDEYLASAGNDGIIRIWDVATRQQISSMIGGNYAVPCIAYSPKYDIVAIANNDIVRLRNLQTIQIEGTLRAPTNLYSIAFNPYGNLIVAGDLTNYLYIWNIDDVYRTEAENYSQPLIKLGLGANGNNYEGLVWQVKFHPSGKVIASAGGDHSVRLWDVITGDLLDEFNGHSAGVSSIAFHPDGNILVSGGLDGILNFWKIVLPDAMIQGDTGF